MIYAGEKRRLLGWLAALAPLPLPFNDVVGWLSVALFEVAVLWFVLRSEREGAGWLSFRAMNVLAVAYLPFLLLDFGVFWRGRILQPLVHLAMFTLVVKLFGMQREKDKWHALFGIFFLFLAGTGTSVHPSLALYLIAWWTLGLYVLLRFAALELFARHQRVRRPPSVPVRSFFLIGMPFLLLVAVPLFAFMPRLRQPYMAIPGGGGGGGAVRVSGLQEEEISLDFIGRIRTDRSVAFRVRYEGPRPRGDELRFRAGSFERYEDNRWYRSEGGRSWEVQRGPDGFFRVAAGRVRRWMEVWLQPGGSKSLPVHVEAAALDVPFGFFVVGVQVDEAGVVRLHRAPRELMTYRIGLTDGVAEPVRPRPRVVGEVPARGAGEGALDPSGVTPEIAALASRVAGEGGSEERARRLEAFLLEGYDYTLDLVGGSGGHRVERFLLAERRGHCELFASALTLMLRAEGIPARLVSGYLGGDHNPLEGYYVVRQANAHAWVEAEVEGGRWIVLDPTPPAGRPGEGGAGLGDLASSMYDFILFRWDRYVLTYGFADQVGAMLGLRDLWIDVMAWWNRRGHDRPPSVEPAATPGPRPEEPAAEAAPQPQGAPSPAWLSLLLLLAGVAAWLWWSRPRLTASGVYRRLRERVPEAGRAVETLPPLEVARILAAAEPRTAEQSREIVALYVRESFAGRKLEAHELDRLREAWRTLRRPRRAA